MTPDLRGHPSSVGGGDVPAARIARSAPAAFEVVVVGAGPAGSAAAYTAAREGASVCLLDKSQFPRDKLCGGLITPRTKFLFESIFERNWDASLFSESDRISFFSNRQYLASLNGHCRLYFTMRRVFDAYLLSLAEAAGVHVQLGTSVVEIDLEHNQVVLANSDRIRYLTLIGADGVSSTVARRLFGAPFERETIGFGLEVEVPRDQIPQQGEVAEVDFGVAKWGYGWVFPKRQSYTIGLGGIHRLNPDLRARLETYLASKGVGIATCKVKGQYIPFGDFKTKPGLGNVLLCGDAAGAVDPITGEGIAYALETGAAAAAASLAAIRSNLPASAFHFYLEKYQDVLQGLKQARRWRYLIFPWIMRRPFAWAFADAGTLQRGYLDILAGKHDYNALPGLLVLQLGKGARKGLRKLLGVFVTRNH